MRFGQISNSYLKYSSIIDYLQFDICGLDKNQAIAKLKTTLSKNKHVNSIILHSDWSKKGCSENNLPLRIYDYIEIYNEFSKYINVIGLTLHPMFRSKIDIDGFLNFVSILEKEIDVFIENRSNSKILVSKSAETIELSKYKKMTIDIPQLLISSDYNYKIFIETLNNIDWQNIKEIHLANIKRDGNRTYVGRSLDDGIININDIVPYIKDKYITLEILGGQKAFERNVNIIKNILS